MTDRRKVQMRFCRGCNRYVAQCIHSAIRSEQRATNREAWWIVWGWVALFVCMGVVFYLGSCA